jgi:hypothetical protein
MAKFLNTATQSMLKVKRSAGMIRNPILKILP